MSQNYDDLKPIMESLKAMPPKGLPEGFADRVMATALKTKEGPPLRAGVLQRALSFLILPRQIQLRPVWQFAWGIVFCLLSSLATMWGTGSFINAGGAPEEVWVRFAVQAQEARQVALVGDFNSWGAREIRLHNTGGRGVWHALLPLRPGVYQYMFVVDGEKWIPDPMGSGMVDDGFGRQNSLIKVRNTNLENRI